MKKIPTICERDWEGNRNRVFLDKPVVDITGATPTEKIDGTCCMIEGIALFKRHVIGLGKTVPENFVPVEYDGETGKTVGWVPVGDGPDDQWHREAPLPTKEGKAVQGTFELIGRKVQANPYGMPWHRLVKHGSIVLTELVGVSDIEAIGLYLVCHGIEGIVWWRDEQPMGKLKRRDLGLPWPIAGMNHTARFEMLSR